MTREKDIREAANKYSNENLKMSPYDAFMAGVEWADTHPDWERIVKRLQEEITADLRKDRWISVEDELPPYGEQVLVFAEEDPDYEMWWSERYTPEGAKYKGVSSGKVYEIMTDRNGFGSMRDENNEPLQVSHWRRIVPPVHSKTENTGKNLKGE